jgi:hypothetical protein
MNLDRLPPHLLVRPSAVPLATLRGGIPVYRLFLLTLSVLVWTTDACAQRADSVGSPTADTLLVRTQQWVDTWNNKDVEGMRRLHAADVGRQRYAIGHGFTTTGWLLEELRTKNFWGLSWSLRIADSEVRMLSHDAALVSFRLLGSETLSNGSTRPFSAAFSMVFQRIRGEWLIVHVHDSSPAADPQ